MENKKVKMRDFINIPRQKNKTAGVRSMV